jgi:hypothetical protein
MHVPLRGLLMTAIIATVVAPPRVAPATRFKKPEGLPKPVKDLTGIFNNGVGKLVKQLSLGNGPGTTGWVAGTGAGCEAVKMTIWPTTGSSDISPAPDNDYKDGVIVALVKNETDCDDNALHIPGGHRAAWVAHFTGPRVGTSEVIDIDKKWLFVFSDNQPLEAIQFTLGSCGETHPSQQGDQAALTIDKKKCDYPKIAIDAKDLPKWKTDLKLKGKPFDDGDDATLWFGCSQTCCYATGII